MKKKNILIMSGVILLLGLALAALWGRVPSLYISLEVVSAVLFTVAYFFGTVGTESNFQSFGVCVAAVGVPAALLALIVRAEDYYGYSGGKLTAAAFLCGGIIFVMAWLSRHETGPLRAALGVNMLPAFFGAAGLSRFISYVNDLGRFSINLRVELCFSGVILLLFALGVFIGANRSKLASANTYLALAIWAGVFGGLLWAGGHFDKKLVPILFR